MQDTVIDEETYAGFLSSVRDQLANPPYSTVSPESSLYALPTTGAGELTGWMVGEGVLKDYEMGMRFALSPTTSALRPILHVGMDGNLSASVSRSAVGEEPYLTVRPRRVELLDREATVMEALAPQRILHRLMLPGRYKVSEDSSGFPVRLPLTATREDMDRIHGIRMTVDAEVYRWEGVEKLALGTASARNRDVRVEVSSPHRLSVSQTRGQPDLRDGLWTESVPLDAQGREMPYTQLSIGPYQ